jgi:hypothetical protein
MIPPPEVPGFLLPPEGIIITQPTPDAEHPPTKFGDESVVDDLQLINADDEDEIPDLHVHEQQQDEEEESNQSKLLLLISLI